jgi:putative hemolysin
VDDDRLSGLLIIIGLLMAQALLTLAQAALTNAQHSTLKEMVDAGNKKARSVLKLTALPHLSLTFQVFTTLIHFFVAAVTVTRVADPFISVGSSTLNIAAIQGLALLSVALLTMILGHVVPEAVGSRYANTVALWTIRPVRVLVLLAKPLLSILLGLSRLLSSLVKSEKLVNTITEEEIMTLVDAGNTGGTIEDEEKEMIYSVLQLDQTRVSEMMVPRIDMISVEINQSLHEAAEQFIQSGYSRIPVYEENIDQLRGLLYAKDLLEHWSASKDAPAKTIGDLMRPAYFVPETKRADELLKELQARKVHLAIVIDEYGGTAGLVTIEDIIEEIIGEILDEYDFNEEADYEQHSDTEYTVDAGIDLDDFNNLLDVQLPDNSDTLGGYIYTVLGRVPVVGDLIEHDRLTLKILSVEGRRIRKIHVTQKQIDVNADDDENPNENGDQKHEEAQTA